MAKQNKDKLIPTLLTISVVLLAVFAIKNINKKALKHSVQVAELKLSSVDNDEVQVASNTDASSTELQALVTNNQSTLQAHQQIMNDDSNATLENEQYSNPEYQFAEDDLNDSDDNLSELEFYVQMKAKQRCDLIQNSWRFDSSTCIKVDYIMAQIHGLKDDSNASNMESQGVNAKGGASIEYYQQKLNQILGTKRANYLLQAELNPVQENQYKLLVSRHVEASDEI